MWVTLYLVESFLKTFECICAQVPTPDRYRGIYRDGECEKYAEEVDKVLEEITQQGRRVCFTMMYGRFSIDN